MEARCCLKYLIIDMETARCCLTLEECECHQKIGETFEVKYINDASEHVCVRVFVFVK